MGNVVPFSTSVGVPMCPPLLTVDKAPPLATVHTVTCIDAIIERITVLPVYVSPTEQFD